MTAPGAVYRVLSMATGLYQVGVGVLATSIVVTDCGVIYQDGVMTYAHSSTPKTYECMFYSINLIITVEAVGS